MDLEDLPEAVRVAADGMRLAAAWQSVGDGKEGRLAVAVLPAAGVRETVVGSRETTTLLTREGTVLHRERLVLGRAGSGVEVRLGSGATLWSASVGGQSVRHLERDGLVVVPVALGTAAGTEVEVVVVERQAIGEGRTRVGITLPELMAPVLEHRWRLLLPEEHRYRFAGGSLAPVGGGFAPTRDGEQGAVPAARTGQPGTEPAQTGRAVPGRAAAAVASLVGRISNERDQPVRGVTVDLVRDGKRVATVSSGADGSYGFAGAEPGEYTVSCRFWGLQPRTAWVIARTGVVSTVNLVMPVEVEPAIDGVTRPGAPTVTSAPHADRTSTVGGRVYDARKHPLQGVLVAVTSPALQGVRTTVTSTTGEFRFQFLPSGTYTLRAERQGFAPREETIDLAPGARMDTSLSLSEAAVALADGVPGGVVSQVPMDYDQALAEKVPLENRGLASYVSVAPAAPAGQAPPSISGAMAHENLYLVNGVVQTDRVRPPGKVQVITRSRTDPVESHAFRWEASNLMQGLVGGVRPVAVSVPENGKVLRLAGALPPRQVRVELDVRSED
ncbi:MAG: carboxypeptidase regulatory-like domain-containing protein [Thermoanaerobaculaceae bacterium]